LVVEGDERRLGPRPELRQDAQGQLPGTVQARLSDAAGGVEGQDHDDRRLLGLDGEDKRAGETEKDERNGQGSQELARCTTAG